jgi:hypothetical protein
MHHRARLGRELIDRHAQSLGRIVEQYPADLRAEDAQWRVIARHRVRAGSVHHALEAGIAVDRLDRRRGYKLHLRPVGVELLGEDQRQRGQRPLTHLGRRRHDGDGSVGRDADPRAEPATGRVGGQHGGVDMFAQREGERQTGGADHDLAAG